MKDVTVLGTEPMRTPVAGVDWAGQTELGEVTLSGQDTIVLERSAAQARSSIPPSEPPGRPSGEVASPRKAPPSSISLAPLLRVWAIARSSLLGAMACGVLGGLLVALLLVVLIRLARAERPETRASDTALLIVQISVQQPSGAPVSGARVETIGHSMTTDEQGVAFFEEPIPRDQGAKPRLRFELVCPREMRPREASRELSVSSELARRSPKIERSLVFICESTTLHLRLSLRVEGGEGQFWLGEREIGLTAGGRLEKIVQVEKRSETVLRFAPTIPKGEARRPRVVPEERTIVVLDDPVHVEQTVKIDWPRRRIRSKPQAIPYRL